MVTFLFQALPLCRLSEDEVGVASLFQVFQATGLSIMPSVRGCRQESESLQGVHEKRGVMKGEGYFLISSLFHEDQDWRTPSLCSFVHSYLAEFPIDYKCNFDHARFHPSLFLTFEMECRKHIH